MNSYTDEVLRTRVFTIITIAAVVGCTHTAEADPRFPPLPETDNGLRITVEAPKKAKLKDKIWVEITFHYDGSEELVFLPESLLIVFSGKGAEYVPRPGGPRNIFAKAKSINPGKTLKVRYDHRFLSQTAVWKLKPGTYALTVRYAVGKGTGISKQSLTKDHPLQTKTLWFGGVTTKPRTVEITND